MPPRLWPEIPPRNRFSTNESFPPTSPYHPGFDGPAVFLLFFPKLWSPGLPNHSSYRSPARPLPSLWGHGDLRCLTENLQETHVLLGQQPEDRRDIPGHIKQHLAHTLQQLKWAGWDRDHQEKPEGRNRVGALVGHPVVFQVTWFSSVGAQSTGLFPYGLVPKSRLIPHHSSHPLLKIIILSKQNKTKGHLTWHVRATLPFWSQQACK